MKGLRMMQRPNAKVAKTTGVVLAGGIVAGALLALSVPTVMKTTGDDNRAAFGTSPSADDGTALTIPIEAAPEDLTPGAWAIPYGAYPAPRRADAWVEPEGLSQANLSYDEGEEEALPPSLIEANVIDDVTRPRDDEAAAMAEAARAAAAEVQSVQSAATGTENLPEEPGRPRAASSTS